MAKKDLTPWWLRMAAHRVDGGDRVVAVDLDLDLGSVGLADVRLVGGVRVDVGLDALDGAGHLRERGRLDLGLDVAGEQLLGLAVDGVPALGRVELMLRRRLVAARGGRARARARRTRAVGRRAGERCAAEGGGADGGEGDEFG